MNSTNTKLEDFQNEKLSKTQQKTVRGGDGDPNDPGKKTGTGNGDDE